MPDPKNYQIKIIKGTVCNRAKAKPGLVTFTTEKDARYLISTGKAIPVETSPPEPVTRVVKPSMRGEGKKKR